MSSNSVSMIDVASRKARHEIEVGKDPWGLDVAPDGKTVLVAIQGNGSGTTVSTIDVASRTKSRRDIRVGGAPEAVAITPCRR
jgi:YVTN family beta-propeller protein